MYKIYCKRVFWFLSLFILFYLVFVGPCRQKHTHEAELFVAVFDDNGGEVMRLLSLGEIDVNHRQRTARKETPLIFGCYLGREEAVKAVLEFSPDLEMEDANGITALGHALTSPYFFEEQPESVENYVGIVKALMSAGASTNGGYIKSALNALPEDDPRKLAFNEQ